ncbi:hypothetical protein [Phycicoccus avicenniae]|uniref:hypothetical protein n=1 Tax=Phycicoccus avicenniae TaxID=2828860 RepID=UPI003D270364
MADPAPPPVTDPAVVFPDLDALRRRALSGDVAGAVEAARATGDPADQGVAWEVLARAPGLDVVLDDALGRDAQDHPALLLTAHRLLLGAEDDGAGERATEVAADRFAHVHDRLRRAEEVLLRLCAEDPGDPQPWVLRLRSAAALGLPHGEARRRYGRLHALDPHHGPGQRWFVRALSPSPGSGGAWDEAMTTARDLATAAAPGSVEGTVLAAAHLARWRGEGGGRGHLRRRAVLGELEDVADRFRAVPTHPTPGRVLPHTELAVLFGVAGREDRARTHFRALGSALAPEPWEAAGRHRDALARLRAEALAERVLP